MQQNIAAIVRFYSRIPLIWCPWGQTGVGLSNIPFTKEHLYWLKVLTGNFLLPFLYLSCRNNQRSILFGYLRQLLVQACQGHLLLFSTVSAVPARDSEGPGDRGSRVFTAEEDDGIGDKGSADTRTVNVRTLLEDFWNWDPFPQMLKNQNFWSISLWNKGILL